MRDTTLKSIVLIAVVCVIGKVLYNTLPFLCDARAVDSIVNTPIVQQHSQRFKQEEDEEDKELQKHNRNLAVLQSTSRKELRARYEGMSRKVLDSLRKIEEEREKEKVILTKSSEDVSAKLTAMLDRLYVKTKVIDQDENIKISTGKNFVPMILSDDLVEINRVRKALDDNFYDNVSQFYTDAQMEQIKILMPSLIVGYLKTGVFPSVSMSQFAIECTWGDNYLWTQYNNGFGIKADSSWTGDSVSCVTHEFYDASQVTITDAFRVYPNKDEGALGLCYFLKENSRYGEAGVFEAENGEEQIRRIHQAGYATSPSYSSDIIYGLMQPHRMHVFDDKAKELRDKIAVNKM